MREACFDADKDGVITHDEFLKGLARTKGQQAATDPFAQAVLQVMDRAGNADGLVITAHGFTGADVMGGQFVAAGDRFTYRQRFSSDQRPRQELLTGDQDIIVGM